MWSRHFLYCESEPTASWVQLTAVGSVVRGPEASPNSIPCPREICISGLDSLVLLLFRKHRTVLLGFPALPPLANKINKPWKIITHTSLSLRLLQLSPPPFQGKSLTTRNWKEPGRLRHRAHQPITGMCVLYSSVFPVSRRSRDHPGSDGIIRVRISRRAWSRLSEGSIEPQSRQLFSLPWCKHCHSLGNNQTSKDSHRKRKSLFTL